MFKVSRRDNLDRYYIFKLFGFGIFIHKIHHDENKDIFHNHPWNGISFVFGSYLEEKPRQKKKKIYGINLIKSKTFHRIELLNSCPVWTLFIHGRRCNKWKVCDNNGNILSEEPWRGIGGPTSYV